MDKKDFLAITEKIYHRIFDAFDEIDPDLAEADLHSDNVMIEFANGVTFVINRQVPTSQIWLATKGHGYHFDYLEEKGHWICDKTGREFFELLGEEVAAQIGQPFQIDEASPSDRGN